jgi:tetratricopeptide (TPR) repeat protein
MLDQILTLALAIVVAQPSPDAQEAYDRGAAAYKALDYAGASDAFEESYELEPTQQALFGWAQAERLQEHWADAARLYRELANTSTLMGPPRYALFSEGQAAKEAGDCERAMQLFRQYQLEYPQDSKDPPEMQALSQEAANGERVCNERIAEAAAPRTRTERDTAGRRWYQSIEGGILSAVGVAGAVTGGVVLGTGMRLRGLASDEPTHADARDKFEEARGRIIGGAVTLGVSGALLITAAIVYGVAYRTERQEGRLSVGPGGLQVRF